MSIMEFTAYTATIGQLTAALSVPGIAFDLGAPTRIAIEDDDASLDVVPTDASQTIDFTPGEAGPVNDIGDIRFIEITSAGGDTISLVVIIPEEDAQAVLIPLDAAGTTLRGIQTGDEDLSGQSYLPTELSDPPSSVAYCFAGETQIKTPYGSRMVKDLLIGDKVTTIDGKSVNVEWIGRQTVDLRIGLCDRLLPVKIKRGALGKNLPSQDLVITKDHAILLCGVLVNAGALVNGTSIVEVPRTETGSMPTYYHIDTRENHIVLANDVPAETLADDINFRSNFDNFDEYAELYGNRIDDVPELPYPRVMSQRQLPLRVRDLVNRNAVGFDVRHIPEIA